MEPGKFFCSTQEPEPVGRESEAHPAFNIISSLNFERYHLRPFKIINARSTYSVKIFQAVFYQRAH